MMVLKFQLIILLSLMVIKVCYSQGKKEFKTPNVVSLNIESDIKYRFATTMVTSRVKNVHDSLSEAIFDVTLPNEAFITNLTLEIDDVIVQGEIKEKKAALEQYVAAQRRGESAAYLGTKDRETNKFNLAVTVAPQSKVSFNLTYQELLRRTNSYYEQVMYINARQPVSEMEINVNILESRNITFLRVPPLRNDINDYLEDLSSLTVMTQPTPKTAHVKIIPSAGLKHNQSKSDTTSQIVVQYDVERGMDAGDVLLVNGYFVHFFAPEGYTPIPRNVLFILDTSGSMGGQKLKQLKDAMKSIIRQLHDGDRMNIIEFSSYIKFYKPEMVDISHTDVIDEVFDYIDKLTATGGTNIELALREGIEYLNQQTFESNSTLQSPVIVFLTDGEATNGIVSTNDILRSVRSVNEESIPIFSLAFGNYADFDLVKKVALQNNGFGRKIYEASDAAMQIIGLYNEISVTLLNNITFEYLDKPVTNLTKHIYSNYYNGTEMVVCGVMDMEYFNNITSGSDGNEQPSEASGSDGNGQYNMDSVSNEDVVAQSDIDNAPSPRLVAIRAKTANSMNIILSGGLENIIQINDDNLTKTGNFEEITEKVWAYLTIKQLLDKKLITDNGELIEKYTQEILQLSLKYGFVTPLTSMVVTLPTELRHEKTKTLNLMEAQSEGAVISKQHHGSSGLGLRTGVGRPRFYAPSGISPLSLPPAHSAADFMHMPQPSMHEISVGARTIQSSPGRSINTAKRDRRKNRKKNKTAGSKKAISFPIIYTPANSTEALCFRLSSNSEYFKLYEHQSKGLRIEMKMENSGGSRRKHMGAITEIRLKSNNSTINLTSDNINGMIPTNDGYFDINSDQQMSQPNVRIVVDNTFNMLVTVDNGILQVFLYDVKPVGLSGDGLLGQLFSKEIKFLNEIKSNKGKTHGLFQVDGIKGNKPVIKRQYKMSSKSAECYDFKKLESRLFELKSWALSSFTV